MLITFEDAVRHLKLQDADPDEQDITFKMQQAEALVINYLKRPDHGWTVDTDPEEDHEFSIVQAAILKVLTNLDSADRGDAEKPRDPLDGVIQMLAMLRDPALA
jgi:hypothetical protein